MTLQFAPSRSSVYLRPLRPAQRLVAPRPANDNGEFAGNDVLLEAALRHFAQHGIGAAQEARKSAEKAFFADDREAYQWWLSVCRTLDRRIAFELERRVN